MALMFPRMARNFAKYGYYPTDCETLAAIEAHLSCADAHVRAFDPCCGEGAALYEVCQHLQSFGTRCETYGIELDPYRAQHAKTVLSHCIHSNIEDTLLQHKGVGLLFLNPPYGNSTKEDLGTEKTQRLEVMFFDKTLHTLQDNGVLVLIVPESSLSDPFCARIASTFVDIEVWLAPEREFKQVVIMGRRFRGRMTAERIKTQIAKLKAFSTAPIMSTEAELVYPVPGKSEKSFHPICSRLDGDGLSEEIEQMSKGELAWAHFDHIFQSHRMDEARPPLCPLGSWHTALALAAGQVTGIVENEDKSQRLLIKGSTYKRKHSTIDDTDPESTVMTNIDIFVPIIKGIDVTPGSADFGEVIVIQ